MSTYFRPWRRKIGAMTLVTACLLMVGWVRSGVTADFLHLNVANWSCDFGSFFGYVNVNFTVCPAGTSFVKTYDGKVRLFDWESSHLSQLKGVYLDNSNRRCVDYEHMFEPDLEGWQWKGAGVYLSKEILEGKIVFRDCAVPYLYLVSPLTFIAAYLLLSKSKPIKSGEKKRGEVQYLIRKVSELVYGRHAKN